MALRKFAYLSPSKVEGETSLPWEFIMTVQHSGKFGTGLTMSVLQEECCCSVVQSCLIPCDPMDCSMPGFPVLYHLLKLAQTHVHESMMPSNNLCLCCPLLLLPSIFPRIRIFSNESVLHIRWPKYWSFSFRISLSNEYSGLISFTIEWFDFLAVQGTLKTLL